MRCLKGYTSFGAPRDVCREGVLTRRPPADLHPIPASVERRGESIVRLQAGTNRFDSQKGMTGMGTNRREITRMLDSKHPDYDHERSMDVTTIPSQMGSNKYASQSVYRGFGSLPGTPRNNTIYPEGLNLVVMCLNDRLI